MRTKTLLLTAIATGVAASAMAADPVYSQNVVGFVNLTIPKDYALLVNQLNVTNGNPIGSVIPSVPAGGIQVYKWNNGSQLFNDPIEFFPDATPAGWYDTSGNPATDSLNPGEGFFLLNGSGASFTLTLVGEVPQGPTAQNTPILANYTCIGSAVPQSLGISAMGFPGTSGMQYYKWVPATQLFADPIEYFGDATPPGWYDTSGNPSDPTPAVGEGFFLLNGSGTTPTWTRSFTVN